MSKILITGGGGYVGSMLTSELISMGHQVLVVDLMKYDKGSLSHLYFFKNFKLIKKDIRDRKLIKKLLKEYEFVIPLAALVGAPLCDKFPKETIRVNKNSILLLKKLIKKKSEDYIFNNKLRLWHWGKK